MATPWWLGTIQVPVDYDTAQGSMTQEIDKRNGRPVWRGGLPNNPTGPYYYGNASDKDYFENKNGQPLGQEEANGPMRYWPLRELETPPGQDEAPRTATFVTNAAKGLAAPYGNLGGEVGVIDGKMTYLYPMDRGASIDGDLGVYGGAQRARWSSPSQSKGTVVKGPDGNFWVAPPADARFSESDTANHTTMLQGAWRDFGPIIMAAAGGGAFTGGESLSSMLGGGTVTATSNALAGAATSGAGALLSGQGAGGALEAAARGGLSAGVGSGVSSEAIDAGWSRPMAQMAGNVAGNVATGRDLGQSMTNAAMGTLPRFTNNTGGQTMDELQDDWMQDTYTPTDYWAPTAAEYDPWAPASGYDPLPTNDGSGGGWATAARAAGGAAGTSGPNSNSPFSSLLRTLGSDPIMRGLGMASGGLGVLSGINSLFGGGLFGNSPQNPADAAKRADPFAQYRDQYAQQLNSLMSNPSLTMSTPGYQFGLEQGLQGIQRQGAKQGLSVPGVTPEGNQVGAGSLGIAMQNYGQNYALKSYNDQVARLSSLSGAGVSPVEGQRAFGAAQGPQLQSQQEGVRGIQQGMGALGNIFGSQAPRGYGTSVGTDENAYDPELGGTVGTGVSW